GGSFLPVAPLLEDLRVLQVAVEQSLRGIRLTEHVKGGGELLIRRLIVSLDGGQLTEGLVGEGRGHRFLAGVGGGQSLARVVLGFRMRIPSHFKLSETKEQVAL